EAGVRRELVGEVAGVPGVKSARPWLVQQLQIIDLDNRAARLIGGELGDKDFLKGNPHGVPVAVLVENFTGKGLPPVWDPGRRQAFISRDLYEERRQRGISDDAPLKVRIGGREVNLVPLAIIELEGMAAEFSRSVVAMEINLAAAAVGRPGLYSRIDVTLDD